jgi:hypothetical protein
MGVCGLCRALAPPNHHRGARAGSRLAELAPARLPPGRPRGQVESARPYDLRRSFVSLPIQEGRTVVDVADQAGHTAETCLRHYARLFRDALFRDAPAEKGCPPNSPSRRRATRFVTELDAERTQQPRWGRSELMPAPGMAC